MSDEDKKKHADYQKALEEDNTMGTQNSDDYATVKSVMESDIMKPKEYEFPTMLPPLVEEEED